MSIEISMSGGDLTAMQQEINLLQERGEATVVDLVPTEGQVIIAPTHNSSLLVLNLRPASALTGLAVQIAGAGAGSDGDRVFIHCTQTVSTVEVVATGCVVFNQWISFNPGDSVAFLKNDDTNWSRIVS